MVPAVHHLIGGRPSNNTRKSIQDKKSGLEMIFKDIALMLLLCQGEFTRNRYSHTGNVFRIGKLDSTD